MNSRLRWTFAITSLALFEFTLDRLVVAIALPAIRTAGPARLQAPGAAGISRSADVSRPRRGQAEEA